MERNAKGAGMTRRGFLALGALGLGALVALASPLRGRLGGKGSPSLASNEFPGEDSIFHPRRNPREVAREKGSRTS